MKNQRLDKRPVIGISASIQTIENGYLLGLEHSFVNQAYVRAVQSSGGIPILLPILDEAHLVEDQIILLDGLILSGGYDISPLFYQEEPSRQLEKTCLERDHYEIELIKAASKFHKPILGICRGMQLLNVVFGGTLHQDILAELPDALQHVQKGKAEYASHHVKLIPQTRLREIFDRDEIPTNSVHHQSIKKLAPGFKINAQSRDGIIEGIEQELGEWIVGVQWHPELMYHCHPIMKKLFAAFIEISSVNPELQ